MRGSKRITGLVKRQSGIGLPVAIFIITVLAAFVIRMGDLVNDNGAARGEQASLVRAMMMARTGAGLALNQMFPPSDAPDYENTACASSMTFPALDLSLDPGMSSFLLEVGCETVGVPPNTMYVVTSKGTCDGVSRSIQVDAR